MFRVQGKNLPEPKLRPLVATTWNSLRRVASGNNSLFAECLAVCQVLSHHGLLEATLQGRGGRLNPLFG